MGEGLPNAPLRVVHVASGDLWAGAEVQLFQVVTELGRRPGLAVSVVLLNEGLLARRLREAGVPVAVFDENRLGPFRIALKLIRYLRGARADIVHTHRLKENVLGAIAALLVPGARSLRTVHGGGEFDAKRLSWPQRLSRGLERWVGRHLQARVVAVSEDLAERLKAIFPARHLAVIANGLRAPVIAPGAPALPLPGSGRFKVCLVGRLVPIKRVDIFAQVCRALIQRGRRDVDFYVIGDGPLGEQLSVQAANLGISANFHFLGFVTDTPALLARMDALLMPSDHEGLPMTLLEAMAVRVPVLAHAVGAIPEVLEQGRCGILLDHQDPARWADALEALLASPERAALTERAFRRMNEHYSAANCARQYAELYARLSGRPSGAMAADTRPEPMESSSS